MYPRLLTVVFFMVFFATIVCGEENFPYPPVQPKNGFTSDEQYYKFLQNSKNWYKNYSDRLKTLSADLSKRIYDQNTFLIKIPYEVSKDQFIAVEKATAVNITYYSYISEIKKSGRYFSLKELKIRLRRMRDQSEYQKKNLSAFIGQLDSQAEYADKQKVLFENEIHKLTKENKKELKKEATYQKATQGYVPGIYKWWNSFYVVAKKDHSLDAYDQSNNRVNYGFWKETKPGHYIFNWRKGGWTDKLKWKGMKLDGKNNKERIVWGTKISDTVPKTIDKKTRWPK